MLASALENAAIICEEYGDDPEETFSYITRSIDIRVEMADETSKVKDFDKLANRLNDFVNKNIIDIQEFKLL